MSFYQVSYFLYKQLRHTESFLNIREWQHFSKIYILHARFVPMSQGELSAVKFLMLSICSKIVKDKT